MPGRAEVLMTLSHPILQVHCLKAAMQPAIIMITRDMENTIAVTADVIINREYSILLWGPA